MFVLNKQQLFVLEGFLFLRVLHNLLVGLQSLSLPNAIYDLFRSVPCSKALSPFLLFFLGRRLGEWILVKDLPVRELELRLVYGSRGLLSEIIRETQTLRHRESAGDCENVRSFPDIFILHLATTLIEHGIELTQLVTTTLKDAAIHWLCDTCRRLKIGLMTKLLHDGDYASRLNASDSPFHFLLRHRSRLERRDFLAETRLLGFLVLLFRHGFTGLQRKLREEEDVFENEEVSPHGFAAERTCA